MNNKSYRFKKYFLKILNEYKKKTYQDFLKEEYPITEVIKMEETIFTTEIVLLEKHRDHLLLVLDISLLEPSNKFSCCGNSIGRTFIIRNSLNQIDD